MIRPERIKIRSTSFITSTSIYVIHNFNFNILNGNSSFWCLFSIRSYFGIFRKSNLLGCIFFFFSFESNRTKYLCYTYIKRKIILKYKLDGNFSFAFPCREREACRSNRNGTYWNDRLDIGYLPSTLTLGHFFSRKIDLSPRKGQTEIWSILWRPSWSKHPSIKQNITYNNAHF